MAVIQRCRLGIEWHKLHRCIGTLTWSQGKMLFCSIERKQNKTVLRQRCVKDECRDPDCSLTTECDIDTFSLTPVGMV